MKDKRNPLLRVGAGGFTYDDFFLFFYNKFLCPYRLNSVSFQAIPETNIGALHGVDKKIAVSKRTIRSDTAPFCFHSFAIQVDFSSHDDREECV